MTPRPGGVVPAHVRAEARVPAAVAHDPPDPGVVDHEQAEAVGHHLELRGGVRGRLRDPESGGHHRLLHLAP